jgi:hypothetical protein
MTPGMIRPELGKKSSRTLRKEAACCNSYLHPTRQRIECTATQRTALRHDRMVRAAGSDLSWL